MPFLELIGIILLIVWACQPAGGKKKNNYTSHYPGDYTLNHTPPPSTSSSMPTKQYPGGDTSNLNKEFEK